jgi:asparagine synthase (glutamine-hydrolysing)
LAETVQARPGPPLGSEGQRRRPVGRIGGGLGLPTPRALAGLAHALGPDARVLVADACPAGEAAVVCDWDSCWLDGAPVRDLPAWQRLLAAGRLPAVRGAFALAWRAPDGALYLARDAIGERTLFYATVGAGLVFASTLRALLATGLLRRRLDLGAIARYLTYAYVPGRETLIAGISELLPGEIVAWRRGALTRTWYWALPGSADDRSAGGPARESAPASLADGGEAASRGAPPDGTTDGDAEALRRCLRARLETAVARRLPAGETVGASLSGGVDSSLVVALARRLHDAPLHTYSVSFGAGYPDELAFSSLVAAHCGTEHHIVELPPDAVVQHLDDAIGLLDKPIGDPLTVPNALLFREASSMVGVVLNGEGGDPCFGGPKNLPMLLAELLGGGGAPPAAAYARERSYLRAHQKCYDDLPELLTADVRAAIGPDALEQHLAPYFADPRFSRFVDKLMAINVTFKGAHHILAKVDAVSAPFGVVPRAPLFDRDVVELAFAIPPQLKLRGTVEKYLLKEAVRDLLPPSIVERPKSGMLVPVEGWFQGPLLPEARTRLLDGLAPYGLFERGYLERLLAGRLGGLRPRRGAKIWLLVTLEAWLRTVFARDDPRRPTTAVDAGRTASIVGQPSAAVDARQTSSIVGRLSSAIDAGQSSSIAWPSSVTDAEQSSSIADPSSVVDTGQSPSTIGRPVSEIDR